MTDLHGLLDAVEPPALLPRRRADEAARMQPPLALADATRLGIGEAGDLYHLLVVDARGVRYGVPAVVARSGLRRAVVGDGASAAVIGADPASEREVPVDQTNELVVVGDCVVKWYLHPSGEDGVGLARLDLLAAAGFHETPAVTARLRADDGSLIALVMEYLPEAQDGWDWMVDDVRAMGRGGSDDALGPVDAIAGLVARMHLAFGAGGVGRASEDDAGRWLAAALGDADSAGLDPTVDEVVRARLGPLGAAAGTPIIPVHGDLHVGQVLRVPGPRYVVIDFDGNPVADVDERTAPAPAARDVAGMLASLDHVGRVVIHRTDDLDDDGRRRVLTWIREARARFLQRYVDTLAAAGHDDLLDRSLLVPLLVQQECREYAYADRYLPHWRYVPDAALPPLLAEEGL